MISPRTLTEQNNTKYVVFIILSIIYCTRYTRCIVILVIATAEKFDFEYRKKSIDDKDGLEATCKAEGLYPQPTLDISVK